MMKAADEAAFCFEGKVAVGTPLPFTGEGDHA
jgi:hypothetical protein